MTAHTCPICTDQFETAGAARDHTWNAHSACHYCGEQLRNETDERLYRHWLAAHPDDLSRVDYKRADTAVDSLTFSERLSEGGVGAAVGGLTRRQLLLAGGSAATAGVVIGATALSNNTSTEPDGGANTGGDAGAVATAPIPDSPSEFRYATMGSADADVTVTYFGSWKCPYCAQFGTGMLSQLVMDYVEPGTIALEFRNLAYFGGDPFLGPDAPAAGQAGLAVWNTDPASYWAFHEYVFRNQPPESDQWATTERLVSNRPRTCSTDSRVPSMTGFPASTSGLLVMRSRQFMIRCRWNESGLHYARTTVAPFLSAGTRMVLKASNGGIPAPRILTLLRGKSTTLVSIRSVDFRESPSEGADARFPLHPTRTLFIRAWAGGSSPPGLHHPQFPVYQGVAGFRFARGLDLPPPSDSSPL